MRELPLDTPLFEILGGRAPLLRRFEAIGIKTAGDLLRHFPSRYEDYSRVYSIAELEPGQQATVQAAVENVRVRRTHRGLAIVEATLADESGSLRAVWFNQPYVANTLRAGRIANFAGKVSMSEESELYLNGPAYEIVRAGAWRDGGAGGSAATGQLGGTAANIHTARLVPVYPETRGLTSRGIRFAMRIVFKKNPEFVEWIPPAVLTKYDLPEVHKAVQAVHFPVHIEDAMVAQRRFAFENLFLLQLFNAEQKSKLDRENAPVIPTDIERVKAILAELPFELTQSQKKSLWDVIQDIAKPKPMNRLLQGDVGSGKTIVAAIAAILAAEAMGSGARGGTGGRTGGGYQTAFMAPTEILARQHFETMKKLIVKIGGAQSTTLGFITGTAATVFYGDGALESKIQKKELRAKVADGTIAIVFGTHALIQKTVAFKNLGFVIVDEQHRFGVRQRAALLGNQGTKENGKWKMPHFLSMSATPIPRTLTLTVFGDLDLSLITELPTGRKPIETKIVAPAERAAAYDFIRTEIKSGRQAFVICPRIEASNEKPDGKNQGLFKQLELKSVKEEFEKLSKHIFPDLRVAMLHGQMKPGEKEDIMRGFKDGAHDVLVATSVVEVGVDVPNATIMMIEGADRFGLAQLYQFRGRVGRGEHQSYCFLMSEAARNSKDAARTGSAGGGSGSGEAAHARLQAILKARNGFELAEYDLKLRGPGEFFGNVQTGFPDELMQALQNPELVKESRDAAAGVIQADPAFAHSPALRVKLNEFRKRVHRE